MISPCLSTECTDKDVDLVCGGCSGAAHGSSEERCTSCICDQLILFCFILFYPILFQQATTVIRQHATISAGKIEGHVQPYNQWDKSTELQSPLTKCLLSTGPVTSLPETEYCESQKISLERKFIYIIIGGKCCL